MIVSMAEIDSAMRTSWAADTCSADDAARVPWTADNPAWGHCDVTALVVHDLLGGELIMGEVHLDGEQHGYHWWNRLDCGLEVDLTREQFQHGEVVTPSQVVTRPPVVRCAGSASTNCSAAASWGDWGPCSDTEATHSREGPGW